MATNDLLELNPRKVIRCLKDILPSSELQKIENEVTKNVKQLIRLGEGHLRYAHHLSGRDIWRQRVSRAYYACYSASKAVRLAQDGSYNTEARDHKKIGNLPDNFPDKNIWQNKLTKFRADRNIADYDHSAKEKELEYSSSQYLVEASDFVRGIKAYLKGNA